MNIQNHTHIIESLPLHETQDNEDGLLLKHILFVTRGFFHGYTFAWRQRESTKTGNVSRYDKKEHHQACMLY
jgi:hypothetical protein